MKRTIVFVVIFLAMITSSCGGPAPATQAQPTTMIENATEPSVVLPTEVPSTATPLPPPTPEPSATPLPGTEIVGMNEFAHSIPWLNMVNTARPGVNYIGFNVMKVPFNNVLVRQAFAAAIDRQALVDIMVRLGNKSAKPATSITPPETLGRDLFGEVGIAFDPAKAKELFIKAGYSDPNKFPVVTLLTNNAGGDNPGSHQQVAEALVRMWKETLGVTVNYKVLSWKSYAKQMKDNPPELFRMGWAADYNDPDSFLKEVFYPGSEYNYGGFRNSDFNALVKQAAKETDPAVRQDLYIQAERILCEDQAAVIPIYHSTYNMP